MRLKAMAVPFLAVLFAVSVVSIHAQVVPSAYGGNGWPLVIGAGFSDFSLDWNPSARMDGVTVWAGWNFRHLPSRLDGLGLELEGRDLNLGRLSSLPRLRQDTALGGPIYAWKRYDRLHPYAKWLIGLGSIDFSDPPDPIYTHDTRTVLAPGGGVDYRLPHNLSVRVDYEYQFWRQIFGPHDLNPNGFTMGATYSFGGQRE